ncbi:MAG TPA: hypothetical protein VGB19_07000 [Actinomycetota bacterium]
MRRKITSLLAFSAMALTLFAGVGTAHAIAARTKVFTFPGPGACRTSLQDCLGNAPSGSVIRIAATRVDQDLTIVKSVMLRPVKGKHPVIGGGGTYRI